MNKPGIYRRQSNKNPRVKTFADQTGPEIDDRINSWIEENDASIHIKDIIHHKGQTSSYSCVMIVYYNLK